MGKGNGGGREMKKEGEEKEEKWKERGKMEGMGR